MELVKDDLLILPPIEEKVFSKKRKIGHVDLSTLKPEQAEVFEDLKDFVFEEGSSQMHLLQGYAGTGKTYITSKFVEWFVMETGNKIAVTATTNKAIKVLKSKVEFTDSRVVYSTVHSMLGLKEVIDYTGKISFKADKTQTIKLDEYEFLIVDEVSMLNDELFYEILNHTKRGLKVLFVGDGKQIPPVGQESSIPFNEAMRRKYCIGLSSLENIVRQVEGNPIIDLSMLVRSRPFYKDGFFNLIEPKVVDRQGIVKLSTADEDGDFLNELLQVYFTSEHFKRDADFMKVVAYRNVTVDYVNDEIRTMIFGEDKSKIMEGEKLIANSPILLRDGIVDVVLFNTNDEFTVDEFKEETRYIGNGVMKYYRTQVSYENILGETVVKHIDILHEDSQPNFDAIAEDLKKAAIQEKNPGAAAGRWVTYYNFIRTFADVKYNYAITAHKSQGSTYENCVVLESDLSVNRNKAEANKIKYTAFTRPSNLLFLVE